MAHVIPQVGNDLLDGAAGAFVPIVGLASDEHEFASDIATLLVTYGFDVSAVEDIELLERRRAHSAVEEDIVILAASLTAENPLAMGDFEAYENE